MRFTSPDCSYCFDKYYMQRYGVLFWSTRKLPSPEIYLQKGCFNWCDFLPISYFLGAFLGIFVTRVFHLIITFGIFIGIGFGLLLPSGFTAFNEYFQLRRNVALSICHTVVGFAGMIFPVITSSLMQEYGFRGTAAIYAAFSLHLILAAIVFQPIEWHYKKQEVEEWELVDMAMFVKNKKSDQDCDAVDKIGSEKVIREDTKLMHLEVLSNEKQENTIWQFIVKNLDLTLFNDSSYIILTFGAAMARASEVTFLSLIPALLTAYGFRTDLVGRIFLSVANGLFKIWNRYIFLTGALFSALFLIAFSINSSFEWVVVVSAGLGFLRCFIQIAFPLMFAEKYGSRFKTAFSLNMVVCGFVTLFVGGLSGYVEYAVGSYTVMVYLLAAAYLLCAIPWIVEIFVTRES
ncbi:Major Facilitator Superfamily [Popillia japonica]|uniref:Major Facilitator Superfamily n=1 Tax=Popillia japonica TaxID=7064 RepID=A0AAW1N2S0_POPJA